MNGHTHADGIKHLSLLMYVVFITGFVFLWMFMSVMGTMTDRKNTEILGQQSQQAQKVVIKSPQLLNGNNAMDNTKVMTNTTTNQNDIDQSLNQLDQVDLDTVNTDLQ